MDFSKIRSYLFLGLLAAVTVVFALLLQPFAYAIFWAAVIAALFHPLYTNLNNYLKHNNLSACITLMAVIAIIIVPLIIIGTLLVRESVVLYSAASQGNHINELITRITETIKHNPLTNGTSIDQTFLAQKLSDIGQGLADFVLNTIKNITQNSVTFLIMFVLMLYSLFYFIRDGEAMLKKIMYLLPFGDRYETMLYKKFVAAASSIIKGTILIGGVQGFLGGITFLIAGIDGALIWGVIMLLFSVIPGVGSAIIWFPAGIIELLLGNVWQGATILIVGFLIISTIDNLLRPVLVGKKLSLHPLLILFSTLGGIVVFGASGFMIGPIIAALLIAFWEMYQEYFHKELSNN